MRRRGLVLYCWAGLLAGDPANAGSGQIGHIDHTAHVAVPVVFDGHLNQPLRGSPETLGNGQAGEIEATSFFDRTLASRTLGMEELIEDRGAAAPHGLHPVGKGNGVRDDIDPSMGGFVFEQGFRQFQSPITITNGNDTRRYDIAFQSGKNAGQPEFQQRRSRAVAPTSPNTVGSTDRDAAIWDTFMFGDRRKLLKPLKDLTCGGEQCIIAQGADFTLIIKDPVVLSDSPAVRREGYLIDRVGHRYEAPVGSVWGPCTLKYPYRQHGKTYQKNVYFVSPSTGQDTESIAPAEAEFTLAEDIVFISDDQKHWMPITPEGMAANARSSVR